MVILSDSLLRKVFFDGRDFVDDKVIRRPVFYGDDGPANYYPRQTSPMRRLAVRFSSSHGHMAYYDPLRICIEYVETDNHAQCIDGLLGAFACTMWHSEEDCRLFIQFDAFEDAHGAIALLDEQLDHGVLIHVSFVWVNADDGKTSDIELVRKDGEKDIELYSDDRAEVEWPAPLRKLCSSTAEPVEPYDHPSGVRSPTSTHDSEAAYDPADQVECHTGDPYVEKQDQYDRGDPQVTPYSPPRRGQLDARLTLPVTPDEKPICQLTLDPTPPHRRAETTFSQSVSDGGYEEAYRQGAIKPVHEDPALLGESCIDEWDETDSVHATLTSPDLEIDLSPFVHQSGSRRDRAREDHVVAFARGCPRFVARTSTRLIFASSAEEITKRGVTAETLAVEDLPFSTLSQLGIEKKTTVTYSWKADETLKELYMLEDGVLVLQADPH